MKKDEIMEKFGALLMIVCVYLYKDENGRIMRMMEWRDEKGGSEFVRG